MLDTNISVAEPEPETLSFILNKCYTVHLNGGKILTGRVIGHGADYIKINEFFRFEQTNLSGISILLKKDIVSLKELPEQLLKEQKEQNSQKPIVVYAAIGDTDYEGSDLLAIHTDKNVLERRIQELTDTRNLFYERISITEYTLNDLEGLEDGFWKV